MKQSTINQTAAQVSIGAAIVFIVLLAILHGIEPEFTPSWRMISEYSNGQYGWLMRLAFVALALASGSAFWALKSAVQTRRGKFGLGLLLIGTFGTVLAACFNIDPLTIDQSQATTHGNLHGLASLLSVPTFPIAALLIAGGLKRNPAWRGVWATVRVVTHLTWISLLVMLGTLVATLPGAGKFGPSVPIGWPNRLLVAVYCLWFIVIGWSALKVTSRKS